MRYIEPAPQTPQNPAGVRAPPLRVLLSQRPTAPWFAAIPVPFPVDKDKGVLRAGPFGLSSSSATFFAPFGAKKCAVGRTKSPNGVGTCPKPHFAWLDYRGAAPQVTGPYPCQDMPGLGRGLSWSFQIPSSRPRAAPQQVSRGVHPTAGPPRPLAPASNLHVLVLCPPRGSPPRLGRGLSTSAPIRGVYLTALWPCS